MAEIRRNPFTGDEVVIFPEAQHKPYYFHREQKEETAQQRDRCPFDAHKEEMQEAHLAVTPAGVSFDKAHGWVVRNKFPFISEESLEEEGEHGLYAHLSSRGVSWVVVSRDHDVPFGMLPLEEIEYTVELQLRMYRTIAEGSTELAHIQYFRNVGAQAGASVMHPHSQLIATAFVPNGTRRYQQGFSEYEQSHGSCLMCDILERERSEGLRVVYETSSLLCIAPFASAARTELWIVPKEHMACIMELSPAQEQELAECISVLSKAYYRVYGEFAYNEFLMTRPLREDGMFHWFFVLFPRFHWGSGFDRSTGMMGTDIAPETVADFLDCRKRK